MFLTDETLLFNNFSQQSIVNMKHDAYLTVREVFCLHLCKYCVHAAVIAISIAVAGSKSTIQICDTSTEGILLEESEPSSDPHDPLDHHLERSHLKLPTDLFIFIFIIFIYIL